VILNDLFSVEDMEMKRKLISSVLLASSLLYATQASAFLVDGVEMDAGDQFWSTTLWEKVLTSTSDTLSGVGIVNTIQGPVGETWASGDNDTQLTYYFHDYTVLAWYGVELDFSITKHTSADADWATHAGFSSAVAIDFAGGVVDMYTDSISTGTLLNPLGGGTQASNISDATDGDLWAKYEGSPFDYSTFPLGSRTGGSLYSYVAGGSSVHVNGTGFGYLDITGGAAMPHLNTDGFDVTDLGVAGEADASINITFDTINNNQWPLSGVASVKTEAVPEPSFLALMAIGLLALAGIQRRRDKAA